MIYAALLLGLRFFGKREVGQFTLFDLVVILLVANAVQPAMTGPDSSIAGGLVIIATLLSLNFLIGFARVRIPALNRLLEGRSVVIASAGKWNRKEMKTQGITLEEGMAALREHGIEDVVDTTKVVLEADGSLSVIPKDEARHHQRRRVRFIRR